MISKTSLEQLKQHIDIVEVISNYLELKKSGANFKACCPFHKEDTPSFVISPSKQIYHCFGCGVGGDSIKFVQEYLKLSFQEAVEKIAFDFNFTLEYTDEKEKKDYQSLFESINSFYEQNLKDTKLQYLLDRGLTKNSIKTFEIGYSSTSQNQINFLKSQFFNLDDASEVGILASNKDRLYSRLNQRITFPIRNSANKLIGFAGRTLKEDTNTAKYINSPQTKLFDKSRNFYGLNIAKKYIYEKGTIVIVEGYLDVVLMHQANIKTAVATMGTALSKEHILIIKKLNAKVLLCFDGDNAGKQAVFKASILLSQNQINGFVVIFPNNCDPADMIKNNKEQELYTLMKKPIDIIKYVLNYIIKKFNLSDAYTKNQALQECIKYLQTLNMIIANEYKEYLAKLLNIQSYHINLNQTIIRKANLNIKSTLSRADEKFLKTLIEKLSYMDILFNNLDYEALDNKYFKALFENKNEELLRAIKVRDDIIVYNEKDFLTACKLKQRKYLENELKKLSSSLDDNLFAKMDKIRARLEKLKMKR